MAAPIDLDTRFAAASAPGKVLLAGGYLVTDTAHTGLVFGLSARMHVCVQELRSSPGVGLNEVIVRSPQFRGAEWRYRYRLLDDYQGVEVVQLKGNTAKGLSRNKFIEIALSYTLSYISYMGNSMPVPLDITILADSGYYSQSSSWTECAKNPKSSFIDFNSELADAHKTGLGSSAALVTAFVAALLKHHTDTGREAVPSHLFKNRVHNLAQIAHCAAQGKIGSGFDVAAAVFGSCIYRRFSPSVIERIGDPGHANFSASLRSTVDDGDRSGVWDSVIDKPAAILPQRLRLVMCDVDCGTETPSMVRKVMSWRKEQPEEALRIWHGIQSGIDGLIAELRKLDQESDRSIDNLRETISAIRCLVREMSVKARVPIEPGVQGDLIDACSQIDGIVGGVVPGAGGYDAIALIIEDREEVLGALKTFLQSYQPSAGSTDEATIGVVRVLSVRQDSQGLEFQPAKSYIGWLRE